MNIVIAPILLPLVFLVVFVFIKNTRVGSPLAILGFGLQFILSVYLFYQILNLKIMVLQVGGWQAPFGITLVIDQLSAVMLLVSNLIAFSVAVYSISFVDKYMVASRFYAFFFSLVLGVNGAFITGDAFNLYVWFEVILLSSFVLITMGRSKDQLEGGIKYMTLNLMGSLFFLAGLGLLYGKTGTLNMAHLAQIVRVNPEAGLLNSSAVLFFIAFGIKAALFPLHFWLPASYHTPNVTVTALFAGLLTKVGVYALFRFFTLFIIHDREFWFLFLSLIAVFTMLVGGLAASIFYEMRRILSYHVISQIGYMLMGLVVFTPLGIAGGVYFMIHNMIAKTNTFLISGLVKKVNGTYDLHQTGGLLKSHPVLAVLYIIPALALAGFPPFSGFFAKFTLIKSGYEDAHYWLTSVAVLTSLLTLYSMIKIWNKAFLREAPSPNEGFSCVKLKIDELLPSAILGIGSIVLGLGAPFFIDYLSEMAVNMIHPHNYIQAVMGDLENLTLLKP